MKNILNNVSKTASKLSICLVVVFISACSETELTELQNDDNFLGELGTLESDPLSEGKILIESDGVYTYVRSVPTEEYTDLIEQWSINQIYVTGYEEINQTHIGNFNSNYEVQDVINSLPYGYYEIELSLTNDEVVFTDRTLFIPDENSLAQPRIAYKVSKTVITNLIKSIDRGWVGSFMRKYLPSSVNRKIEKYVLPELRKLLKWDQVFKGNVENAIFDGLTKAGARPAIARWIATMIGVMF